MHGTLYFVHGTGVRDEGFNRTIELIRTGIARAGLTGVQVKGRCWGSQFGVAVGEEELSAVLPKRTAKGIAGGPSQAEVNATFWALLLDDPLFELRLAIGRGDIGSPAQPLPKRSSPDQEALAILRAMRQDLVDPLPGEVPAADICAAADWLGWRNPCASSVGLRAGKRSCLCGGDGAFARCACTSRKRLASPGTAPAASYRSGDRDELVSAVIRAMSKRTEGCEFGGWLRDKATEAAKSRATSYALGRRVGLTAETLPGIGDILFYQRRGAPIVQALAEDPGEHVASDCCGRTQPSSLSDLNSKPLI